MPTSLAEPRPAPDAAPPDAGRADAASSQHQSLMRSLEAFTRAMREASADLARRADCSRATLAIFHALDRRGPLPVGDIAQVLRVDISVASRQVSCMVDEGYVVRQVDADDRRVRTIALSDAGRARARAIDAKADGFMRDVFARWEPDAMAAADDVLDRLVRSLDDASSRPHRSVGRDRTD
ncbi:winged helix-turn-helix transcriptional regulator [Cellulomonas sp. JH27-2]|uniref:MarR family winged helix-turn-helix transcriptional regulator n=1 Tax=Cellulomonas sp. JH27-2 TaxID=2774139 RepID=UPI00178584C8|nr:winged helix-turn-helix transcriptional regulator [Cellulomonas sp. JH27-2]